MLKKRKNRADTEWLVALGGNIEKQISKKYKSPYEFWVQAVGDDISRTTLNYILKGAVDVRATSLRKIAKALGVSVETFFDFE